MRRRRQGPLPSRGFGLGRPLLSVACAGLRGRGEGRAAPETSTRRTPALSLYLIPIGSFAAASLLSQKALRVANGAPSTPGSPRPPGRIPLREQVTEAAMDTLAAPIRAHLLAAEAGFAPAPRETD